LPAKGKEAAVPEDDAGDAADETPPPPKPEPKVPLRGGLGDRSRSNS
jgi:hypothetical protein